SAPISGHVGAYSAQFNPYASCIAHFLDPTLDPAPGEFRCFHDEFVSVDRAIRAADAKALAAAGKPWFGYFATSGQEIVLTLPDGRAPSSIEYAWGPGMLTKFKAGAVNVPATATAGGLIAQLKNGATISIEPEGQGRLRATYARGTQAPFVATLLPIER